MIIAFAECSLGWEVRKLVSRTLPGRWTGRSWCYGDFSTTIFRATTNSTAFIDSREVLQIRLSLNVSGLEQTARFLPN